MVKFIAYPDKFIFSIGVAILGFLFIVSFMLLNQLFILIPLVALWMVFSVFLIQRNHVEYIIQEEKIVIKSFGKKIEIDFNEIECIIQLSNYTNSLKEKEYVLKLNEKISVPEKFLKIKNKTFTKWLLENAEKFKITKTMLFD